MRIVFFDGKSKADYSDQSLAIAANGIGGSEASVVRLAVRLARDIEVAVIQEARTSSVRSGGVAWLAPADADEALETADLIVVLRKISDAVRLRRQGRTQKIIIWHHDWFFLRAEAWFGKRLVKRLKGGFQVAAHWWVGAQAVCVSRAHAANFSDFAARSLTLTRFKRSLEVTAIYNIVQPVPRAMDGAYDQHKLIYFSAPWKGLEQVRATFHALRKINPNYELHVASPDYGRDKARPGGEGEIWLGSLPHDKILDHVATSLCVFYPANVIPETFGLVFAESHAVGTPVLAHRHGSAPEMLTDEELIDAGDVEQVIARVEAWSRGARPKFELGNRFSEDIVARQWLNLFQAAGRA